MTQYRAIGSILIALLAGACADLDTAPYLWPTPFYGDPLPTQFTIRYSKRLNTETQVRDLIATTCGPKFDTARMYFSPLQGTAMHPQMAQVICGNPPPQQTSLKFVELDPGELISLRDPAPPASAK